MPKASKRGGHSGETPYAKGGAGASSKLVNNVFKMNKNLGQHILKNPGVAQAIVDKAGLKQSDVCQLSVVSFHLLMSDKICRLYWKLALVPET